MSQFLPRRPLTPGAGPCDTRGMTKRPRRPRDPNQLAKLIVDMATGEAPRDPEPQRETPATAARRKGGVKGGKARARKLSGNKRRAIAKKAAQARWHRR